MTCEWSTADLVLPPDLPRTERHIVRREDAIAQPCGSETSIAPVRNAIRWLTVHGTVRARAAIGVRRGDPQARMIADPALWADPVPFYEELRAAGPLVPCRFGFLTVDYALTNEMLR